MRVSRLSAVTNTIAGRWIGQSTHMGYETETDTATDTMKHVASGAVGLRDLDVGVVTLVLQSSTLVGGT